MLESNRDPRHALQPPEWAAGIGGRRHRIMQRIMHTSPSLAGGQSRPGHKRTLLGAHLARSLLECKGLQPTPQALQQQCPYVLDGQLTQLPNGSLLVKPLTRF
jgi:hypothetical protein